MIGPKLTHATRKIKQYLAAISVCLAATCAGTTLSWSSPALSQLMRKNISNITLLTNATKSDDFSVTQTEAALIGSMVGIGAMVSAVPSGFLADKFGRKKILLSMSLPFSLSWICIIVSSRNAVGIIFGRFLAGMATGGICVLAPIYIGEIAETSIRGILGTFFQIFLSVGILWSSVVGAFTSWITLSIILAIIPLCFAVTFFFMPESPIYLIKKRRYTEAEEALRELRGNTYDIDTEIKNIQKSLVTNHKSSAGFKQIFSSKANRKSFFAGIIVLCFQQLCGINAVVFYAAPIFKAAGSSLSPNIAAIIVNAVQVIVSYFSIFVIEKAGRKFFLMLSSSGMIVCFIGMGMFFHFKSIWGDMGNFGFVLILCAVLFMVAFGVGYGPVPWMLLGELYSSEIKGVAAGTAITCNWFAAFVVTLCFPLLQTSIGSHYTFYIFAGLNALGIFAVALFIPETHGRSLDEIQAILRK